MAKVSSETRCGTVPNHGALHEVGVRGVISGKKNLKNFDEIWCTLGIFTICKISQKLMSKVTFFNVNRNKIIKIISFSHEFFFRKCNCCMLTNRPTY